MSRKIVVGYVVRYWRRGRRVYVGLEMADGWQHYLYDLDVDHQRDAARLPRRMAHALAKRMSCGARVVRLVRTVETPLSPQADSGS